VVDERSLIERATDYYKATKAEFGVSMRTTDAFIDLCIAYRESGTRIDALRRPIPDEWERFQSRLMHGADGHVFFDGSSSGFRQNNDRWIHPLYYWWQKLYGKRPFRLAKCEIKNCISPYHAYLEDKRHRQVLYPEHVILGALQVYGLRHRGKGCSKAAWDKAKLSPSSTIICKRFGGWELAWKAAGVEYIWSNATHTDQDCIDGVRALSEHLGRPPTSHDYFIRHAWLTARGYPGSANTIIAHLGPWAQALEHCLG